jgi:hypothetical protein
MKPPIPRFPRILNNTVGFLLVVFLSLSANLARAGGQEFHVVGVVEDVILPREEKVKHNNVVSIPGKIRVHDEYAHQSRMVQFSIADDQKFEITSRIHTGTHVTIDGAIMGEEHILFSVQVDASSELANDAKATASPVVNPQPSVSPN